MALATSKLQEARAPWPLGSTCSRHQIRDHRRRRSGRPRFLHDHSNRGCCAAIPAENKNL